MALVLSSVSLKKEFVLGQINARVTKTKQELTGKKEHQRRSFQIQ